MEKPRPHQPAPSDQTEAGLPIYHTEQMLWANQLLYPRAGTYHVPFGFEIRGELASSALNACE